MRQTSREDRERILITGPGGRIGTSIVPLLRESFALRLFDLRPLFPEGDDEVFQGDIRDFPALLEACQGVKALVHLAAISDEDDFYTRLLPMNLLGVYNAFESAKQAGVKKVIFASTAQTVLGYSPSDWVTPEMPPRPITVYACTKLFGEALGRYYSDHYGMSVVCLRIGWFQDYHSPLLKQFREEMLRIWISPRDLTQLIVKALHSEVPYAIFFAVSNNPQRHWDISSAQQIVGYEPQDNPEDYL